MKPKALLTETSKHLSAIEPHVESALRKLEDWSGLGYPTGGQGSGPKGEVSSSTERAALGALERRERDRFAADHAQLVEAITAGEAAFARARKIVESVQNKTLDVPAGGCVLCAEVKDPTTGKVHENGWQRVQFRTPRPSDPEGPKVGYCSFHGEWIGRYGIEPAKAINLWHLDHLGSPIPRAMVQDNHPAEYAAHQSKLAGRPLGLANLDLETTEAS